jgi:hypothetical protein
MVSIVSISISVHSASADQKFVEKIDVRGRAIHVTLPPPIGAVTVFHLLIVFTEKHGKQFVCQGLPFDPATGKIVPENILQSDPPRLLTKGQCIPFRPDNRDFIPDAPSITVLSGTTPNRRITAFSKRRILNGAKIPYHLVAGPNSNSYTRTMLDRCDIPALKPVVAILTSGWDISINLDQKP